MKVALIGATGFVGTAITQELLQRGHEVTTITRHPENVPTAANLKAIKTDVYHPGELAETLAGSEAVISSFNPGWTNPEIYADFLKGSKAIEEAVEKSGIKRLIVIGGAGSLYAPDGSQFVDGPQFPAEYKAGASAARDYLNIIKENKTLDWTFYSPAFEILPGTGNRTGKYRTALNNALFDENGRSTISVEDLAVAIVDELENPQHIQQRFTAAY